MRIEPWSDDEVELFLQLRADGLSNKQIAARLGRSESALSRKLKRLAEAPRRTGHFQPAAKGPRYVRKRAGKVTLPPLPSTQT
jgi:hypothetical protein